MRIRPGALSSGPGANRWTGRRVLSRTGRTWRRRWAGEKQPRSSSFPAAAIPSRVGPKFATSRDPRAQTAPTRTLDSTSKRVDGATPSPATAASPTAARTFYPNKLPQSSPDTDHSQHHR